MREVMGDCSPLVHGLVWAFLRDRVDLEVCRRCGGLLLLFATSISHSLGVSQSASIFFSKAFFHSIAAFVLYHLLHSSPRLFDPVPRSRHCRRSPADGAGRGNPPQRRLASAGLLLSRLTTVSLPADKFAASPHSYFLSTPHAYPNPLTTPTPNQSLSMFIGSTPLNDKTRIHKLNHTQFPSHNKKQKPKTHTFSPTMARWSYSPLGPDVPSASPPPHNIVIDLPNEVPLPGGTLVARLTGGRSISGGAFPPLVRRLRSFTDAGEGLQVSRAGGDLLLTFQCSEALQRMLDRTPFTWDNQVLAMDQVYDDRNTRDSPLNRCFFWVRIFDVSFNRRHDANLQTLGEQIGEFMWLDRSNIERAGEWVRMRVNIWLDHPLIPVIRYRAADGTVRPLQVCYERLPLACRYCGLICHAFGSCPLRAAEDPEGLVPLPFAALQWNDNPAGRPRSYNEVLLGRQERREPRRREDVDHMVDLFRRVVVRGHGGVEPQGGQSPELEADLRALMSKYGGGSRQAGGRACGGPALNLDRGVRAAARNDREGESVQQRARVLDGARAGFGVRTFPQGVDGSEVRRKRSGLMGPEDLATLRVMYGPDPVRGEAARKA